MPSSTQRLHLEFRNLAPMARAESRTGRCHGAKVPPAASAPSSSASQPGLAARRYVSYYAPLRPRPGRWVPVSSGPSGPTVRVGVCRRVAELVGRDSVASFPLAERSRRPDQGCSGAFSSVPAGLGSQGRRMETSLWQGSAPP